MSGIDGCGFSYGGVHSSTFGLSADRETHSVLPDLTKYTKQIVGMDGEVDFGIGGYGTRTIGCSVYFDGDYQDLRANIDAITGWLGSIQGQPKTLRFDDQPGRYYMAKVYAALDLQNSNDRNIGSITFECNPPWAYLDNGTLLTLEQLAWNTAAGESGRYIQTFAADGAMRFTVPGNKAVPCKIILLNNVPAGLTLGYDGKTWGYTSHMRYDGVVIDSAAQTVTRASTGENLMPNVASGSNFFTLSPRQAEITVSAASGLSAWPRQLDIAVEFTAQEGV